MTDFESSPTPQGIDANLVQKAESFIEEVNQITELQTRLELVAYRHSEAVKHYADKFFGQFYPEVIKSYSTLGKETVRAIGVFAVTAPIALIRKRQIGRIIGKDNVVMTDVRDIIHNA